MDSTAKMRMAISANFARTSPKSPMGLPNAVRSLAYFDAVSSVRLAPPVQYAPRLNLPAFKMLNATMCPRPTSCSKFSLGTWQFSKNRAVVELPFRPIFFSSAPAEKPGNPRSTMKHENFFPVHFRENDVDVREPAVGDPHLLTVQDIRVSIR